MSQSQTEPERHGPLPERHGPLPEDVNTVAQVVLLIKPTLPLRAKFESHRPDARQMTR